MCRVSAWNLQDMRRQGMEGARSPSNPRTCTVRAWRVWELLNHGFLSQLHECSMSALATQMQAACTPGMLVVVAELAEPNNIFGQMP